MPVLLLVLVLGFRGVWRHDPPLALVAPVSIVVTMGLLVAGGMRLWPRYFLADLPLLLIFATAGAAGLAGLLVRQAAGRQRLTTAFWVIGIVASALWATRNYVAPKQDFAGAVATVEAEAAPGDIRATLGLASLPISRYFAPDWTVIEDVAGLDRLLAEGRPVWIVWAFDDHIRQKDPDLMARVDARFDRVERRPGTLSGGSVYVVRSHPENS